MPCLPRVGRRLLAFTMDVGVLAMLMIVIGATFSAGAAWIGIPAFIFVVQIPLTALTGGSIGRFAAGLRVARLSDGRVPGYLRGAVRVLCVAVGFPYMALAFGLSAGLGLGMWRRGFWDHAAGTVLVLSPCLGHLSQGDLARLRSGHDGSVHL